jgi:GAF domain-containing protein
VEAALNDAATDVVDGTRALKVDLITPDAVGKLLRVRISTLVPHAEFCLFVPDPGGTRLWPIHASAALRPSVMAMQVHAGEGLAGWVLVNRHTIINSPPDLDFEEAAAELGLKRCVSTPVFAFGTIAGVLSVYTRKPAGFTEPEVRIVGAIAQELGLEFSRHDRTLAYEMTPIDDAAPPLANAG